MHRSYDFSQNHSISTLQFDRTSSLTNCSSYWVFDQWHWRRLRHRWHGICRTTFGSGTAKFVLSYYLEENNVRVVSDFFSFRMIVKDNDNGSYKLFYGSNIQTLHPTPYHPIGHRCYMEFAVPFLPRDAAMLARSWESQFCPYVRLSVCHTRAL